MKPYSWYSVPIWGDDFACSQKVDLGTLKEIANYGVICIEGTIIQQRCWLLLMMIFALIGVNKESADIIFFSQ